MDAGAFRGLLPAALRWNCRGYPPRSLPVRLDLGSSDFLGTFCRAQLYRRMHKKGADGEKAKSKKTRKVNTKGRGVFGASIDEIKKKRDQSAAARATARAKALR